MSGSPALSPLRERMPLLRRTCSAPEATMGGMLMDAPSKEFALAGSLEELKLKGRLVVHGDHRPILVTRSRCAMVTSG
jgi:hypothetical protein